MKFRHKLHTNGKGLWSEEVRAVITTKIELGYLAGDRKFGELRVYFTNDSWNTKKHGLIYTDPLFQRELREALKTSGFSDTAVKQVSYSEQGMQGKDYVSLDVGGTFLNQFLP